MSKHREPRAWIVGPIHVVAGTVQMPDGTTRPMTDDDVTLIVNGKVTSAPAVMGPNDVAGVQLL